MANEEHIRILQQRVKAWNEWRLKAKDIKPDLSGSDLRIKLRAINLNNAYLESTILIGADLRGASFRNSVLRDAKLSGARLDYADFTQANLTNADLVSSFLTGAKFNHTSLNRTKFNGASMGGANLSNASSDSSDFRSAMLNGAILSYAHIYESNFSGAKLIGANLNASNLVHADLSDSELDKAIFRNANLGWVNLSGARLTGADLSGAIFGWTILGNNDLTEVKGLDTIQHRGPSDIGIRTIYRSKGNIPEVFLRGVGVPENFITYMGSLTGKAFEFYSCFISYSSKNQDFAERLYADLQSKGVRCWFAPEDLKIGEKIRIGIDESIKMHDKLLLILSTESVRSEWVEQEVETALAREREQKRLVLFPIRLDNTVMEVNSGWPALIKNTRHIGDFRSWKQHDAYLKALDRLLRDLKAGSS